MTIKGGKNNIRLEGCICEQFAYLPKLVVYPNSSDMNELSAIAALTLQYINEIEYYTNKEG
ncbi:hypothetical protein DEFDS_0896 [Deferribacter desulfuricans SSM1]|uniref:Uncharacterized protein n=1 Tax=Deferribacter desulfuricans (strain DSM 14783 / JCM 11476 / NBRC 101012 / SSM1) TaxID=639282 RepID=D3PCP7_DEFDS|nr:hypothetical protein DEFDS_0896 [Deferribacter desulfuricans SSM1]